MRPSRRTGLWALLTLTAALAGCASRGAPAGFPAGYAASLEHPEAPAAPIGLALSEDPPLPGEETAGWAGLAPEEAAQPLTADAAVRIALRNNRALRAALREVGVARGDLVQAGVLPNPELEVEVTPRPASGESAQIELGVEYDLTSAILAPLRERAARADLEAARYRAAGAVVELGYAARAAYYAAQAGEQRLAVAHRALDSLAAGRDAARALLQAGNVPELDAATQEAGYEAARVAAAQIELELLDRRERLNRALGLSGAETRWQIRAPLPPAPEELATPGGAEAKALAASLELKELRSRMEAAGGRAALARTEGAMPDLSLGVRGEREDDHWQVGAGVRFTLPVFDRRQGASMAREAEYDALLERYHGLAVDIRSALRESRNRARSAHARALHLRRVVIPARERVLAQTLLQYNAMQIGVFQLLQAFREKLDAELAEVETLREFWTAKAGLDALLAGRRVEAAGAGAPAAMSGSGDDEEGGH